MVAIGISVDCFEISTDGTILLDPRLTILLALIHTFTNYVNLATPVIDNFHILIILIPEVLIKIVFLSAHTFLKRNNILSYIK